MTLLGTKSKTLMCFLSVKHHSALMLYLFIQREKSGILSLSGVNKTHTCGSIGNDDPKFKTMISVSIFINGCTILDLVHGRTFANLSTQRSHVDDLEGRYIQLRLFPMVRGRQWDCCEAEGVPRFFRIINEAATDCRNSVGRLLSVSVV